MYKNYISLGNSGSAKLNNSVKSGVSTMFSSLAAWQKKAFLALLFAMFSIFGSNAQVTVTSSGGNGTGNGTYTTLGAAFTALGTTATGAISISITSNTTEAAAGISLGAGPWTSITIAPSGGSRTISGAATAGTPLITFNGADNVTINGGGNLTFSNTTASSTSGTSTLKLIGDATNNAFNNVIILGSASGANGSNCANVWISTGTTTGNDGNSFQSCKFGPAGTNLPGQLIVANGSTTSTAIENSGITINNCEFYDYFQAATANAAIYMATGNTAWTVTNNKIYQTATRTITTVQTDYGIYMVNAGATALGEGFTITGNTIGYNNNAGTGTMTYAAAATAGGFIGINFSGSAASTSTNSISSNIVSNIQWTSTGASVFTGIASNGLVNTTTGAVLNMNSNTVSNISQITSTGAVTGIYSGYAPTTNCSSNTVNNISRTGATGVFYGIRYTGGATTSITFNLNTVSNLSYNVPGGNADLVGFYSGSSNATETFTNNTITGLASTATGAQTISGIYNNTAAGTKTFTGNTLSTFSLPSASTGTIYGIRKAFGGTTDVVSGNNINNFSGGTNLYAISITSGTTNNVFNNKIYGLSSTVATPAVYGIYVTTGTTNNVYNNIIGGLTTSAANTAIAIAGIYFNGGTTDNAYYNTVYLTGTSTGALFGSAALYASTTPTVVLRNNIFVNNGVSTGATGFCSAYRRSSATLTTYDAASNNNLLYGASLYNDGTTNYTTLASYKTAMATRDQAAISENPTFLSTTGSAATFLHIDPSVSTAIKSGGAGIAGYTTDFDGDTRSASGTTDIGADEYVANAVCVSTYAPANAATAISQAPTLSWTAPFAAATYDIYLSTTQSLVNSLDASVRVATSQTGLTYLPSLAASTTYYWKVVPKNSAGTAATGCSTLSFTTDVATPTVNTGALTAFGSKCLGTTTTGSFSVTGLNLTSTILLAALNGYTYSTASNGTYTSTLTLSPTSGSLSATVYVMFTPVAAAAYTGNIVISGGGIASNVNVAASGTGVANLGGTYTVGSTGTYTTLTAAVAAYNSATCFSGNVVFNLTDASYSTSETFPIVINANANAGSRTLTIKPSGTTTITGAVASDALIKLNGAKYVIFDGSTSGGSDKSLTITNSGTTSPSAISAYNLANNITIKNLNISTGSNAATSIGIALGGTTPGSTGADIDNVTISNNNINTVYVGIYIGGTTATSTGGFDNLVISNNSIGSATVANYVLYYGIFINGAINPSITGNTIFNLKQAGSINNAGINVGLNVSGGTISSNNINGIYSNSTGGWGAYGINFSSTTGTTGVTVANNIIYDIQTANYSISDTTYNAFGIRVTGQPNIKLYYNSVYIYGAVTALTSPGMSAALLVTAASSGLDVRNNTFVNTQTFGTTGSFAYSVYYPLAIGTATFNRNDYYGTSGTNTTYNVGYGSAAATSTLANWQTFTAQDANSISSDPMFTSLTNLMPDARSPLANAGTFLSGFTTDYNALTRNASTPTIGAYELSGLSATTLTAFGALCLNPATPPVNSFTITGTALTSNVAVAARTGYTYATTSGGTYSTSLTLTPTAGALSQTVYVKFNPTLVQSYNGNIGISGGGASTVNVAASGSGISTKPSVTYTAASFGGFDNFGTVTGNISAIGCTAVTANGVEYSLVSGFAGGTGTQQAGTTVPAGGDFSASLSGLAYNTTYYYRTYATNDGGTAYSTISSFTTGLGPVISAATLSSPFGNACAGSTEVVRSIAVVGDYLTSDITVAALSGFSYSDSATGTFTSAYTLSPVSGSVNQTFYIKFIPTAIQSYNGNIVLSATSASDLNVAIVASGVASLTSLSYTTLAPASYCVGTAITANAATTNSGTGAIAYTISPALPAGLTLNASTGTISGTPTAVAASGDYVVTADNGCSSLTATITLSVSPGKPSGLTYTTNTVTYCVGSPITLSPTVGGGAVASYSVSPALPAGLSLDTATGIISGTPTTNTASAAYTVTATNYCGTATRAVTITVTSLNGTYTVGTGGNFATLPLAIAAYNAQTSCLGPVVFNLTDSTYSLGTTALVINSNALASSTNTLTIKPNAAGTTITGAVASGALIKLNGAKYVIIDGSTNGGTDKSLTITNTSTTSPTAVSFASLGTSLGTTYSTVKNCKISTGIATTASYGVAIGGTTPGTAGSDNDNITVQNNTITVATTGVYAVGNAAASALGMDNLTVSGNTITTNTTIASFGIQAGNTVNSSVTNNTVSVTSSVSGQPVGISCETGFLSSTVTQNNITAAVTTATGGYGARGITIGTGNASSNVTVANNLVAGVNGSNYSGFSNSSSIGIGVGVVGSGSLTDATGGVNVYYNSVNMSGSYTYAASCLTAGMYVGSGVTALSLNNNILVNTLNNTSTSGTASKNYSIYSLAASTAFTSINNNDYFVSGTQGILGYIGSDRTNLAGIVTGFGQNANSISGDPLFTATSSTITNPLRPGAGSPVVAAGTVLSGVTTDYLNATRSGTTPTIGAYESVTPNCTPLAAPASIAFSAVGPGATTLTYPEVAGAAGYLVVRYNNPSTPTDPTSTTGYAVGDAIGAGTVIGFTTALTTTNSGLTPATNYDYYVYSVNLTNCIGIAYSATPVTASQSTAGCPSLAATIAVGPSQTYTKLSDLAPILCGCPVTENTVVELQSDYVSTGETFPILFTANPNTSNYTITIRPSATATALAIAGATTSTTPLIDLKGAKNYIFEGRLGGATDGGSNNLSITNTGVGSAVRLWGDAQNNTLSYLNLKSSNTSASNGVIRITTAAASTSLANGNNNNTITYCKIDGNGVSPNGIFAAGSAAPGDNKSNTISNNSIFNYYSDVALTDNYGIFLAGNNGVSASSAWTISGNSFYQTAARTFTNNANIIGAIGGGYTPSGAFNITGNFIGGTAASAAGSAQTLTGAAAYTFTPINVLLGGADASSISGNTIANFNVTTASTSTFNALITASTKLAGNTVSIANNTIGSASTAGSISFTGGAGSVLSAISAGSFYSTQLATSFSITNNTIAGIALPGTTNSNSFRGINMGTAVTATVATTITGNTIGAASAPITNASPGVSTGILNSNVIGAAINTNTVQNLVATNTGTAVALVGINAANATGSNTINGNTITNFATTALNTTTTTAAALAGIQNTSIVSSLSNNTISNLTASGNAAVTVHGIYNAGSATLANANLVYGLSASNAGATGAVINGFYINGGTSNYANNVVRLGTVNPTVSASINGFNEVSGANGIYFNSVYIGGSGVGTTGSATYALLSSNTSTRVIQNNVFMNARSNATTGGKHYAVRVAGTTANPSGLTLNNNDYFVNGTNGVFGYFNSADVASLSAWKTATGLDSSSFSANPNFTNATSTVPDLSIDASISSVLESTGFTISGITTDFAGTTRNTSNPDIGAYEFNGTSAVPVIVSVTSDPASCTATSHVVTANVTAAGVALTSGMVKLSYAFNGATATVINMTNTSGNIWTATIPAATPVNATVTFSASVNDGVFNVTKAGTSYSDEVLVNVASSLTASASTLCSGSPLTLTANVGVQAGTYCTPAGGSTSYGINSFSTTGGTTNITNNTTGVTGSGYNNYTATKNVTQAVGGSINYSVTPVALDDGMAIWVDWNQNGTFETGERMANTTAYSTGLTGSFTVPSGASNGTTRMRVLSHYNSTNPTDPCVSSTSVEIEDYSFTVTGGSIYSVTPTAYKWYANGTLLATTTTNTYSPSTAVTANASNVYSAVYTALGCDKTVTTTQTVAINAIPTAPTATNSAQCGSGVPTCSVTSTFGGTTFKWYTVATGGTALPGETAASLTATTVSTTGDTSFYVSEVNNGCESTRTTVTVSVAAPAAVVVSPAATVNLCPGDNVTLGASSTNSAYGYSWSVTPVTGSGLVGTPTTSSINVSPTIAGTYVYSVTGSDGFCSDLKTITITVNTPPTIQIIPASATVCAGTPVTLTAQTAVITAGQVTIGAGTDTTTLSTTGTPYRTGNTVGNQFKNQFLILASELTGAGLQAGNITSLSLDVAGLGGGTLSNLSIKMGHSAISAVTTTYATGLTQVYSVATWPATGTLTTGLQTHNFSTPFTWDGLSNLVIEVCAQLATTGTAGTLRGVATPFASHIYNSPSATGCSSTTSTTSSVRPNIILSGQKGSWNAGALTWTWDSAGAVNNVLTVAPTTTTTYTATGLNTTTGCSSTATRTINVNALPATPIASDSVQCGTAVPTCSVAGTSGASFNWYLTATGGTALVGQSGSSLTGYSIATTTDFYVAEIGSNSCESLRVKVTGTVAAPSVAAPTTAVSSATVNAGGTVTLTATGTGGTITWYTASVGGTLVYTGSTFPQSVNCTPGTYTYYAEEAGSVCPSLRTVATYTVRPLISTSPANALICYNGGSVELNANVTGGSNFVWSPATGLSATNTALTTASPTTTTVYTFSCTVAGCGTQSGSITVGVIDGASFTPTASVSPVCEGYSTVLNSNLNTTNFSAKCITSPPSALSTAPGDAVTLVGSGALVTTTTSPSLPDGVTINSTTNTDDNFWGNIPIGFNFNYFGSDVTNVFIGTNGTINLGTTGSTAFSFTGGFPSTSNPASTIAVCARDLRYDTGNGAIRYWTEGIAPTRRFVVQYDNVDTYSGAGKQSAEAVFYETTGVVDIRVFQATNGTGTTGSSSLIRYIGLQDATRLIGATSPNCSTNVANYWNGVEVAITSPQAWRFTPAANYSFQWYLDGAAITGATTGTYTTPNLSAGVKNYKVVATNPNTVCAAEANLAVTVTAAPNAPTSGGDITECASVASVVLTATPPTGAGVFWYTAATGGTAINSVSNYTLSVTTPGTYYAESKNTTGSCVSATRTAVVYSTYSVPSAPTVTSPLAYCQNGTSTALSATAAVGNTLLWYTVATGGTGSNLAPTPSTATAGSTTYYVAQVSPQGCISARAAIVVTVGAAPSAPSIAANGPYCMNGVATQLSATGSNIIWYTAPTGGTGDTTAPTPDTSIAGTLIFYASQTNGSGCESARASISVLVNPILNAAVSVSASTTSACSGGAITFTATPTNGGTPTYQWWLNGTAQTGETASTYVLGTPAENDAVYVVMTSTASPCLAGSPATSNTVTLTASAATPTVSIAVSPTNATTGVCPGTSLTFSVLASTNMGATPTYNWMLNGTTSLGTSSTLVTSALVNAANITLEMTSSLSAVCLTQSSATSSPIVVAINPPTSVSAPTSTTACLGSAASFSVTASGTGPFSYQWKRGTTNVGTNSNTLNIASASAGDVGSYTVVVTGACGNATSTAATFALKTATSTNNPTAVTQCAGTTANFSVTAAGEGTLTYQWRRNGNDLTNGGSISGADTASLSVANIQSGNAGAYSVVVTGSCGTATSGTAALSVQPSVAITAQPSSSTLCAGATANFSVTATGLALTYQWMLNGVTISNGGNISGATTANLSITNVQNANAGDYTVAVGSTCGTATSSPAATLTVNATTAITTQPVSSTVCAGGTATFTVGTAGVGGITYQWTKDGTNLSDGGTISGATSSTLTITNVTDAGDAGVYRVKVSGGTCSAATSTSTAASLSVPQNTVFLTSTNGSDAQTVCSTFAITTITYGTTTATGATVTGLPTGVTGNWSANVVTISGTPTQSGTFNYTVTLTGGCGNVTATGSLTVSPLAIAGTVSGGSTICAGNTSGLLTASGYTGTILRWESSVSPFTSWSAIANTDDTYTSGSLTETTRFRVVVISGVCSLVYSATTTVSVNATTVAGTVTGGAPTCSGTSSGLLTATGYTGSIVRWESSVSPFTSWTSIANTAATYTSAALTETTQFRVVIQSGACSEGYSTPATVAIETTTWSVNGTVGSWSNGTPSSTKGAIIAGNYTSAGAGAGDLTACSLTVNAGYTVIVTTGDDFNISGAVSVDATSTLTFNNNANLLQGTIATTNTNSGSITAKRNGSMRRLEYTYWSAPVANQNLLAFSPLTLANRFYTFNEPTNAFVAVASPSTTTFGNSQNQIAGKGFMIRTPNTFLDAPAAPQTFNGIFTGVPNNGTYTFPVSNTTTGNGKGYNLIGNPYPSPINASLFLAANPGTLYFWTHASLGAGANNYASYTEAGSTAAASNGVACNGTIQTGQGFLIQTTINGNATFTNAMRIGNNEGQFFKTAITEKHRIWLNLNSATTAFNQIMVGYIEGATQGVDTSIDGSLLPYGSSALSSRIDNADYVIQGRALPFATADTVPLGFNAAAAGEFTISIDHVDGLFLGSQEVYLKDNLLGTTYNIKASPYTFTSASGVFNSRFEIVYTSSPLGTHNPTFDAESVVVYKQEQVLHVNSGTTVMAKVRVFDVRGRLIFEKNNINATAVKLTDLKAEQQVLLVQITSDDNRIVTKKVVY